ncbi:NAD(P)H-dependent glycerol-3-phosphate dehydrogenase [Mycoplasma leonicaptivi]|uniref:NAD(P)H-dependent glycerol-3-phosphate dehydrogenase n=1 Tax=Mycoplasma leonicaptivi TaxID=36742 RepID=UPI0004811536|nr:NAD(P)H-dependent glycerol-3-phosphate dehydrogenase [Mycoplasma leonicaptivi]
MKKYKFGFIGTGAYGSALANVLLDNRTDVIMYGINESEINDINYNKRNSKYFGNAKFSIKSSILATNDLDFVVNNSEILVLAIPSNALKSVLLSISKILGNKKISILNLSKGIESQTNLFFSQFIKENFAKNLNYLATILGPSFANEVFYKQTTIINIVSDDGLFAREVKSFFNNEYFRLEYNKNVIGCEIFSALKNVLAIGMGIAAYNSDSKNKIASLVTKGYQEIIEIYKEYTKEDNIDIAYEYGAIGDIILTCTNSNSRNFSFGLLISEKGIDQALKEINTTVEGYETAKTLEKILLKQKNTKHFFQNIIDILFNKKSVKEITDFLKIL